MNKKKPLLLVLCAVGINSCGTRLPSPPAHDQGTLIQKDTGEIYGYWVPYYQGSPYRTTLRQFVDRNVVCVSAEDYGKLKKYSEDVLAIVKKSCPKLVK